MKFNEILLSIVSDENHQPSSKRISGLLGWILCLVIVGYSVIIQTQPPEIVDILFYTSTALLGVEAVVAPFKKGNNTYGTTTHTNETVSTVKVDTVVKTPIKIEEQSNLEEP